MALNVVDIVILAIIAFFVFKGFKNGFLDEFSIIFGFILGVIVAKQYSNQLVSYIKLDLSANTLYFISFAVIVLGTIILAVLLASVLSKLLSFAFMGWVDRILGAAFGLLKGTLVIVVALYLVQLVFDIPMLKESYFMPYYDQIISEVNKYLDANPIDL